MKQLLTEAMKERRIYFDGGMGTVVQAKGLPAGTPPEQWNLTNRSAITEVHMDYLNAGCDVLTTNTFGVNCMKYENYEELLEGALLAAKDAVKACGHGYIAFDIGPTGKLLKPLGDLEFEDAVTIFANNLKHAKRLGADCIIIETMNDAYETKAAVLAAKESCDLPIFVTNVYDESAKLMTGADPEAMIALLEGLGVTAIGMNCSLGPDKMIPIAKRFAKSSSLPIIINPNAGLPDMVDGKTVYKMDAELFSDYAVELAKSGANILGGCCGTTPAYMKRVIEKTKDIPLNPVTEKNLTRISSYTHSVDIGPKPLLIGERINPTGKSKFKEALRNRDITYILQEGIRQSDKGVHILDVNVGLPEIDETDMMVTVVKALQEVLDLPLQIDTTAPDAMEAALRIYNGKALINSVNGKQEVMDVVFPLVKHYGGTVIALTIDEEGIPDTADRRMEIVDKIVAEAAKYGIGTKDLVFDPLAMAISSDQTSALTTIETVRRITEKGYRTSLGVSNISFGLPNRNLINSVFYANAMENGLSLAIMNPFSVEMMSTYYAFLALHGMDNACMDYISFAEGLGTVSMQGNGGQTGAQKAAPASNEKLSLEDCIVKGLVENSAKTAAELIGSGVTPLDVIQDSIIPALNRVGQAFEAKKIYLPQLLVSADAATAAFNVVKEHMTASAEEGKGFVLATVKGDVHDIGKNIVKVLLESYGFLVYDLGKDVPPEVVVKTALEKDCHLIGLSALMTTTVPSMEETIKQLHEAMPDAKVVVGGAVLNKEYAEMIHADFYAKDAMETVRYAQEYYK